MNRGAEPNKALNDMPVSLRAEIMTYKYEDLVGLVPLFQNANERLIKFYHNLFINN